MISIEELERRMQPGAYSVKGFLGVGEKLTVITERDRSVLKELGLSYELIAGRLDELLAASIEVRKEKVVVGQFEIRLERFRGFQLCPWSQEPDFQQCKMGSGVQYGSIDWEITNRKIKRSLSGPGLIVHLVRDHHFFEGLGSPYRVDPLQLAQLLELA
ncbi:MAG: hypothetical protein IPP96_15445 [Chitinophagaceae bacterium]|nr:hypothetical protein [Chitinophagaceae bacterium]